MRKFKLSHKPLLEDKKELSPKEEREIMKDMILSNITLYSAVEISHAIKEGIVSYQEVEDVLTPSNG